MSSGFVNKQMFGKQIVPLSFACNRPEELFIYNWTDLSVRTLTLFLTWMEMSSLMVLVSEMI